MIFTQKELEHMKQFSKKNPDDKVLLSILNKMQGTTCIENLTQEIIKMASKTHPDNPNKFIESPKYDGNNMVSFLTKVASGYILLDNLKFNTDFNMIGIDGEPYGHQCDVTDEEVDDLKQRFINCVCKENPNSPHIVVYNLRKALEYAPEAIKSICHENQSQIEMKVHSRPGWNYCVPIENILHSCAQSLPDIYLGGKHNMQVNCSGDPIDESNEFD